jgi:hypothetical protein
MRVKRWTGVSSGCGKCRGAIESQFPGAVLRGFSQDGVDKLRVALYSAQKGLEDISEQAEVPDWMRSLPDEIAWSISNTLHALAPALRDDVDEESRDTVARKAQVLRGHVHEALTQATKTGQAPFAPTALLAALTLLSGGEVVAQSITQARKLAATPLRSAGAVQPKNKDDAAQADTSSPPDSQTLSPTLALAIQAVVAAVAAGLIAKAVGNEQSPCTRRICVSRRFCPTPHAACTVGQMTASRRAFTLSETQSRTPRQPRAVTRHLSPDSDQSTSRRPSHAATTT